MLLKVVSYINNYMVLKKENFLPLGHTGFYPQVMSCYLQKTSTKEHVQKDHTLLFLYLLLLSGRAVDFLGCHFCSTLYLSEVLKKNLIGSFKVRERREISSMAINSSTYLMCTSNVNHQTLSYFELLGNQ